MSKLAKFRALSWPEQRLFLQSALSLPLVSMALATLGIARLRRVFEGSWRADGPIPCALDAAAIAALVSKAANNIPVRTNCLTQSLWLHALLMRRGKRSALRIGVRRMAERFEAHAWVECEGMVMNDTPKARDRYAAFDRSL